MRAAAAVVPLLCVLQAFAGVDTLTAEVKEFDFDGPPEMYQLEFGAGCSLACGIWWVFDATSELSPQAGNSYSAGNLGDIDMNTAWVEGVAGNGEGEAIIAVFCQGPEDSTVPFRAFTVQNGYAKNVEVWQDNSRVHLLEMRLNGELRHVIELADTRLPQSVSWVDEIPVANGDVLELVLLSVYPGDRYEDTAVTELIFWGAH